MGAQDREIEELLRLLKSLDSDPPRNSEGIRAEVRKFVSILKTLRRAARNRLVHLTTAKAGRDRILAYFKMFVGEVIESAELAVVSGIQDFPRRIRELRVQYGYKIFTGYTLESMRPNQYLLENAAPNEEEAKKWQAANTIRRMKGAGQKRILELLRAYVGLPVTGDQIHYVAKLRDPQRRARELRTELGWRVVTKNSGRPDLPVGVYVLESLDQLPAHDRHIKMETHDAVLQRDNHRCVKCRWSVEKQHPSDKKQFLEVHHIEHHAKGGPNNKENLTTLCNVHHDKVHKLEISGKDFLGWLKKKED